MKPTDKVTITISVEQLCILNSLIRRSESAHIVDFPKDRDVLKEMKLYLMDEQRKAFSK